MSDVTSLLTALEQNRGEALARLFDFLRVPSISTDPAYASECRKCAQMLVDDLTGMGFNTRLVETPGHPIVWAQHHQAGADQPHVLFYGHYDVQPVDPLDLWQTPPFEPQLQTTGDGGQIILARGASDDKGQVMTFLEACRVHLAVNGKLPINVTIVLEGEEESGSTHLNGFLSTHKAELSADIALICDTNMWNAQTPAIATMLRGLMGEEVTLRTVSRDLHSGLYGGAIANPIQLLTSVLASLHDENGRVTVPGFYDGVPEIKVDERTAWGQLGVTDDHVLSSVGATIRGGEQDFSSLEKIWARPTLEFNGIHGGYTGEGFKTVLPAVASTKISCRLVGAQDPDLIRANLRAFIRAKLPPDADVTFQAHGGSPGVRVDLSSPLVAKALAALKDEWRKDTALIGMGGSIPVVGTFKQLMGMDSLLIGFALEDDRIHSPNEKYNLSSFERGARSWVRILSGLYLETKA